jgi:hypothetical protein
MIQKEFVPYEEALALKELDFNEPCFGYWKSKNWLIQEKTRTDGYTHADQECSAPTFSQAFRWFREQYGLYSCIMYSSDGIIKGGYSPMIDVMKPHKATLDLNTYDIYEEAELACLRRLIEIVKTV